MLGRTLADRGAYSRWYRGGGRARRGTWHRGRCEYCRCEDVAREARVSPYPEIPRHEQSVYMPPLSPGERGRGWGPRLLVAREVAPVPVTVLLPFVLDSITLNWPPSLLKQRARV